MDLSGQTVVVVGLGRSGLAAARLLAGRGARVVASDRRPAEELGPEVLGLSAAGVRLELGAHRESSFTSAALVVVSPGVPWDLPELHAARRAGVAVIAELELGYRCLTGTVGAVTGTKGKSTTTAALGAMLREAGRDVRVAGNIGEALSGQVEGSSPETVFVLEVSSFQLEGTERFRPRVAVFLNLTPDHLDRHLDFAEYASAKARIFENQTPDDWAVVNADDPQVLALARRGRARLLGFHPRPGGAPPAASEVAWFDSGLARLSLEGHTEELFALSAVRLPGAHLAGDLLAAAAAARLLGARADAVSRAVASFRGAEHVLEYVGEVGGVAFYNDSKATNVDAVRHSLEAFDGPILAIMGGRYKGGDFATLHEPAARRVKTVFAIGEASDLLIRALSPAVATVRSASLGQAVRRAFAAAAPGDTVLLAPGCSSFDMFRDYAERGAAFKAEVQRLAEDARG